MDLKLPLQPLHILLSTVCACVLLNMCVQVHKVDALPQRALVDDFSIDRYDRDYYVSVPISDYRLSRLRRGYYYVDDGFITSVPSYGYAPYDSQRGANRRQDDSSDDGTRRANYQPLVKYKQTKAKRKKLFVPNFFG